MQFHRDLDARQASLAILDPLPFRLVRRAGIRVPPPPFLPMWFNLVLVFIAFDVPLTAAAVAWPLLFAGTSLVYLLLFALAVDLVLTVGRGLPYQPSLIGLAIMIAAGLWFAASWIRDR